MHIHLLVHPSFDLLWPFAADHMRSLLEQDHAVTFCRLEHDDSRTIGDLVECPRAVEYLISMDVPFADETLQQFSALKKVAFLQGIGASADPKTVAELERNGVKIVVLTSE